ncbi:hypothetical protein ZHAS_00019474 [Anopheles sinensis]|uniref:Uncharacterized protein n=1 Tax=Anopheles sinensis TaxID=74873 RepID=A0A084WLW6_ANOSI|nr:hypothetical protein ZHAS_00019474 [Anopheles sinensis]
MSHRHLPFDFCSSWEVRPTTVRPKPWSCQSKLVTGKPIDEQLSGVLWSFIQLSTGQVGEESKFKWNPIAESLTKTAFRSASEAGNVQECRSRL